MSVERLHGLAADNFLKGLEMDGEAGRFGALASRHTDGTAPRAVSSFNLFQTPPRIAAHMVELAAEHVPQPRHVLEPSAGLGRLFLPARERWPEARFTLVEESSACMAELYKFPGAHLLQGDFLSLKVGQVFDVILMNPPFERGRDIKHILHARALLAPGGVLVGLCYDGVRQNKKLRPLCQSWEVLPAKSFKAEGTAAGVALVTMGKGGSKWMVT